MLKHYQLLLLVILSATLSSICTAQSPEASAAASETLIVSLPLGLTSLDFELAVGDEALLSWTGGEYPYSVRVIGRGETVDVASGQQFGLYSWVISVPPGTGYQVEVTDATGYVATSERFAVVAASSTPTSSGSRSSASRTSTLELPGFESYLQPRKSSTARAASLGTSSTWSKTSSAFPLSSSSALPASSHLPTSTMIGIIMGGIAFGLFLAALAAFLLRRRRRTRASRRQASSLTASGEIDPSPAVDPFPYTPNQPMTSTAASLASGTQPIHPGLLQQYSSGSNVAYLHPLPLSVGQPDYFAGPPPMPSPMPSASLQTGFLPSSSSGFGDVASSVGTSETAQERREAKTRLFQAATPAQQQQQPLVIQETDSGAVDADAAETERLPPMYNQAWGDQA